MTKVRTRKKRQTNGTKETEVEAKEDRFMAEVRTTEKKTRRKSVSARQLEGLVWNQTKHLEQLKPIQMMAFIYIRHTKKPS